MKKSPVKQQKQRDIDSLANAAYEKWYAKNVQNKKNALERMKYDETHLQRDESLPVYNTQNTTNILKGTGATGRIAKKLKNSYNSFSQKYREIDSVATKEVSEKVDRFKQKVKNFGTNVKNFLDAHQNRYKKQSDIPMPRFGEDPKN